MIFIARLQDVAYIRHTEQFIIAALRATKALTVSLVAELNGRLVGHQQEGASEALQRAHDPCR